LAERFPSFFHKILVDAPCSGEGMFRKNPEAAQEWSLAQVEICADRQLMILENAAKMLMDGGKIVYSTCTFSPEENEGVIGHFLERHPEFSIVSKEIPYFDCGQPEWGNGMDALRHTFRLWPHHLRGEGHFAAILQKIGQPENKDCRKKKPWNDKKLLPALLEFTSDSLQKEVQDFILSGNLTLFGDQLYRLPDDAPDLSGLHVLRAGLHIGTFKKNRFEPAHALALFLGSHEVKNSISLPLSDSRIAMFYHGESFETDGKKGWCLVCVNGFSAGWGKIAGGQLKNHYPKGLRKDVLY
jgi:NOL1/NOP2/fmu family ribosome biogenesis protein